jgi:LacI family transcriptional regulator
VFCYKLTAEMIQKAAKKRRNKASGPRPLPLPLPPRKPGAATIADVAAYAGFAPMTVSRVINGEANVRPETRKAVQAAVAKLKYSPNLAARTLAGAEQIRIGLLYSNPSAAFLSEFLVGSLEQARVSHIQLVVEKCDADQHEDEVVRELLATGVDGVILPPPLSDSKRIHAAVTKAGAIAVAVASASPRPGYLSVRIDDHAAAMAMTRHILSLGHRRIGFIVGNPDQTASAQRLAGYRAALAEAEIAADDSLVQQGLFTYRSGLKAAERLLGLADRPTAVFASNDDMGAATVAVAHRHQLDVPKGLTVCGFDDSEFARSIWPELTTIRQPIADMARSAVLLLIRKIKARREGRNDEIRPELLDFTLVRRESDGPPRRAA